MLDILLKNQGLTGREVAIYTFLTELGEQPASIIAKRLDISRSSCYLSLDRLIALGLISQISKNGVSFFQANDLSPLLDELQRRRTEEINQIKTLKLNLQVQRKRTSFDTVKSQAHYFSGEQGIINLISQMSSLQSPVKRVFLSRNLFTNNKIPDYLKPQPNSTIKVLSTIKQEFPDAICKKLPAIFDFGVDLILTADKVAVISFAENFALLVESRLIANAQSKLFDFFWKIGR